MTRFSAFTFRNHICTAEWEAETRAFTLIVFGILLEIGIGRIAR
jgi:hypothetical protein